jgi:hypothetical protein
MMGSKAHHSIAISVTGAADTVWSVPNHLCFDDHRGEVSVRRRAIEEGAARGYKVRTTRARYVTGLGWEVDAIAEAPDGAQ